MAWLARTLGWQQLDAYYRGIFLWLMRVSVVNIFSRKLTTLWIVFNSLWPSDTIWRHRSGSTLAQVMACCLTAPSHYLNHCWLINRKIQWHWSESNLTRSISWLLMPWLLTSPGHQQPWYWLCRIGRLLSYFRKAFNYLRRINVEKWHKM